MGHGRSNQTTEQVGVLNHLAAAKRLDEALGMAAARAGVLNAVYRCLNGTHPAKAADGELSGLVGVHRF